MNDPRSTMTKQMSPLTYHIKVADHYLIFDGRTYAVIETDEVGVQVLNHLKLYGEREVPDILSATYPRELVCSRLEDLKVLFDREVLSVDDVEYLSGPSLDRMIALLTSDCNLACKYCFESHDRPEKLCRKYMSTDVADQCIDYLFRHSSAEEVSLIFYGGEPLMNMPVLKHFVLKGNKYAESMHRKISYHIVTNGTLMTDGIASYLAEHGIHVQVSIDGSKEHHDNYRPALDGDGSYDRAREAVALLEKHNVEHHVLSVINNSSGSEFSWFKELHDYTCGRNDFCSVASSSIEMRPSAKDIGLFLKGYRKHLEDNIQNSVDNDSGVASISERKNDLLNHQHYHFGCGGGLNEITIMPNGDIDLCERIAAPTSYNICSAPPPDSLWYRFIRNVTDEPCRKCWAKYLCGGGCAHTYKSWGGRPSPIECAKTKLETIAAIKSIYKEYYKGGDDESTGEKHQYRSERCKRG